MEHEGDENVSFVKYEDLLEDPHIEVERLLRELSLPSTDESRRRAIEQSTFKKMKDNAQKTYKGGNAPFVRKGIAGEWRNSYSDEAKEMFCKFEDLSLLDRLGYVPF